MKRLQRVADPFARWASALLVTACACLALFVIWCPEYPPLVDLPQHAALASILVHYHDNPFGYADTFALNLFTPYVVPYLLVGLLHLAVPLVAAFKLLLTLALLLYVLSLRALCRHFHVDPWLAVFGFVLFFNFAYWIGVVGQVVALPFAVCSIWLGFRARASGRATDGLALALLGVALFFTHLPTYLLSTLAVSVVLVSSEMPGRRRARLLAALVPGLLAFSFWALLNLGRYAAPPAGPGLGGALRWSVGPNRPLHILATQVGLPEDTTAALSMLLLLLASACACRPTLVAFGHRWYPFLLFLGVCLFGPTLLFGLFFVDRLAIFLFALALPLFDPGAMGRIRTPARMVTGLGVGLLLFPMAVSVSRFDAEADPFGQALERAEPGNGLQAFFPDKGSRHLAGSPYRHFAGWYQARFLGTSEVPFACFTHLPVTYRNAAETCRSRFGPGRGGRRGRRGRSHYYLIRRRPAQESRRERRLRRRADVVYESGVWVLLADREWRADGNVTTSVTSASRGTDPRRSDSP